MSVVCIYSNWYLICIFICFWINSLFCFDVFLFALSVVHKSGPLRFTKLLFWKKISYVCVCSHMNSWYIEKGKKNVTICFMRLQEGADAILYFARHWWNMQQQSMEWLTRRLFVLLKKKHRFVYPTSAHGPCSHGLLVFKCK